MANILSFSFQIDDISATLIQHHLDPGISTLDQASNTLPVGAYTTFRTYNKTNALYLSEHFHRLEESAALAGHPVTINWLKLREHLREALQGFPEQEARIRITIPFEPIPYRLYIFLGALSVPTRHQRENGVRVLTADFHRDLPKAKLTNFIHNSQALRERLKEGFEEILMVNEAGRILEGLTSNFFAVITGVIHTAGAGILSGITRQMVLQIAENASYRISLDPPELARQTRFEEAFITSTSRGVLPVVELNHKSVGTGKPGPITRNLLQLYDRKVAAEIQPI